MKALYIDTSNSGISGDMFLAAILELVPNPTIVIEELKDLKDYLSDVSKLEIELIKIKKNGIRVNQLKLNIIENKHHRAAKILKDSLNSFLNEKHFTKLGIQYANNVLETLFRAEADVHGDLVKDIHLHELSSVDTLIDIVGVTRVLESLGVFNHDFAIYCSNLPLGRGTIKSAHGNLPVPAPATLKILENSGLVVYNSLIENELVTPTGAALLVNLKPIIKQNPVEMKLERVVYSTGQKDIKDFLNILRIFYGNDGSINKAIILSPIQQYIEEVTVLETDVDDISGEIIGNFINSIEKEYILDIQVLPSLTKKNRPGHVIKILCYPENTFVLIEKILHELGTLGVRFDTIKRVCVNREIKKIEIQINSQNYELNYKISYIQTDEGRKIINVKPEFDDLKRISVDLGLPVREVSLFAQEKISRIYKESNLS